MIEKAAILSKGIGPVMIFQPVRDGFVQDDPGSGKAGSKTTATKMIATKTAATNMATARTTAFPHVKNAAEVW
jgi:hypothetical protein